MAEAHAEAHAHDAHDDDYAVHSHITSIRTYSLVFGALLFLTGLTVAAYNIRLGEMNLFVAVLIAMMKSSLVGAYFMHLKYESKFNTLFFVGSLIFVGVFLGYTLNDTDHRGEEGVQGMRIDPATGNYAYGTATVLAEEGEFTPFHEEADGEAPVTQPAPSAGESPEADEAPDEVPGTVDEETPRTPATDIAPVGDEATVEPGLLDDSEIDERTEAQDVATEDSPAAQVDDAEAAAAPRPAAPAPQPDQE